MRIGSGGEEAICRILGCLSREECRELRQCFDSNRSVFDKSRQGRTLAEVFMAEIGKPSYLDACLQLISSDTSSFPLGVDRECSTPHHTIPYHTLLRPTLLLQLPPRCSCAAYLP